MNRLEFPAVPVLEGVFWPLHRICQLVIWYAYIYIFFFSDKESFVLMKNNYGKEIILHIFSVIVFYYHLFYHHKTQE